MLNYANMIRNLENKLARQEAATNETREHIQALRQQWTDAAEKERQAPLALNKEKDGKK